MSAVWVALIVVCGPVLLAAITGHQRRAERKEDWAHQDEVSNRAVEAADKAAAAARQVAVQAAEAASLLVAADSERKATRSEVNQKLDVIHTLVNSTLSAAKEAEFAAREQALALMRQVVDLNRAAGREPDPDYDAAIDAAQTKLDLLHQELVVRAEQTKLAEKQMAATG